MNRFLSLLMVMLFTFEIFAQKYIHYHMNDGSFNGFYTSDILRLTHDTISNSSTISHNGMEFIIPLENVESIVVEDALMTDASNADYRIYESAIENDLFKKIIVDNRACLMASKNGDFGSDDTIFYFSKYNDIQAILMTDENGNVNKIFNGQSLYCFVYDEDEIVNALEITADKQVIDHPEMIDSDSDIRTRAIVDNRRPRRIWDSDNVSKINSVVNGYSEFAHNYDYLANDPEFHNQMLLLDSVSILFVDVPGVLASVATAMSTGGLTWFALADNARSLCSDLLQLMEDMHPDYEQRKIFEEFYRNKYAITVKTISPENVKSDAATIRGTFSALNGVKGKLYFKFSKLGELENGELIDGELEQVTESSFIVKANVENLKPTTNYIYVLWYECDVDGLHFSYISDEATDFRTLTPSVTTSEVVSTSQNSASVKCSFTNIPEGAICGIQYGNGDAYQTASAASTDGEHIVDLPGLNPDTRYDYRAFIQYDGENYYGETKHFTTDPVALPDLSGTWTFTQGFLGKETVTLELELERSSKKSASYKASGFYGVTYFSMSVSSDGSANIALGSYNGPSGHFSGKFNDDFTSISGSSYTYDFGPNNWAVPPAVFDKPWVLSR